MEEIICLIIGLVVWVLSAVFENNKEAKKNATSGKANKPSPLGEQFPAIEVFNEASEEKKPQLVSKVNNVSTSENIGGIMSQLLSKNNKKEKKTAEPSAVKKEDIKEQPKQHGRYAIIGKSEAKRAFIYSEIFNRKY